MKFFMFPGKAASVAKLDPSHGPAVLNQVDSYVPPQQTIFDLYSQNTTHLFIDGLINKSRGINCS